MNLNKIILTSLCAIVTATAAYAAGENIVASKKYTDDTFQTKISAAPVDHETGYRLYSAIGNYDEDGEIQYMYVVTSNDLDLSQERSLESYYEIRGDPSDLISADAVRYELDEHWQPKISTGNVFFHDDDGDGVYDADDDVRVPGIVTFDPTTEILSGEQFGILDYNTIVTEGDGALGFYHDENFEEGDGGLYRDKLVPTVRAVANELQTIRDNIPEKIPKSGYSTSNIPYNTNAANVYNSWLNAGVKGTGLVTKTANNGAIGERKIFESTDVANYHAAGLSQNEKDIQDISIPTVGAMMTAIQNGSAALIPAGTAGNVVTYTGTAGVVGSNTVASAATYNQQTGALTNGSSIANVTLVETKQKKKVCAGWPDYVAVADRTDANCWLWSLPD